MTLSHRIQLDPTAKQRKYFLQACGTSRFVWNWALAEWKSQYEIGGKPFSAALRRYFNSFKYEAFPWLKKMPRDAHSQPFNNLHIAFADFFKGKAKYPKFKKKGRSRDSYYVANDQFLLQGEKIRLPHIGFVRMRQSLRFSGKIMSATISRDADRWFISFVVEMPDAKTEPPTGDPVGIDLGISTFATLSNGEKYCSPKPLRKSIKKMRRLSRVHQRRKLGSNNRRKASRKLARLHYRIKSVRRDFIHKLSTNLTKKHSRICVEGLVIENMIKNRRLARSIHDSGWGSFIFYLKYKSLISGSEFVVHDRFFASTKTCSSCGVKDANLTLADRSWVCKSCGTVHDRDINAAINLLQKDTLGSRGIYACGDRGADTGTDQCETAFEESGTTLEAAERPNRRRDQVPYGNFDTTGGV